MWFWHIFQEREIIAEPRSRWEEMLSWNSVQGYICLTHRKTHVQWSIIKSAESIHKQNLQIRQIHPNLRSLEYFSAFLTQIPPSTPHLATNEIYYLYFLYGKLDVPFIAFFLIFEIHQHILCSFFPPNFFFFHTYYHSSLEKSRKIWYPEHAVIFHCSHQWQVI